MKKVNTKNGPVFDGQNATAQATAAPNSENLAGPDGGLPAAPCSGSRIVVLPESKIIINLDHISYIGPFYDPTIPTGMIITDKNIMLPINLKDLDYLVSSVF